jgi:hypothetical protein
MAFAEAIKYNRIRSMKGLPIGAIVPWASDQSTIPTGWILCNGATISNTRYPILFSVIGNSYGGTVGSTYRLPPLTSGQTGIVDVFRGHYIYFKGGEINSLPGNEVNLPTSTSKTDDPFWSIVGFGTNGDTGNNSQTVWLSTIDVVGEQEGRPTFPALYDDMEVTDGQYSFTVTYTGTALGANHMPPHTHGALTDDATSYRNDGGRASWCNGNGTAPGNLCRIRCDSTSAFRVAANPNNDTRVSRGNNQAHLRDNFLFFDARIGLGGTGGGGNIRGVPRFGAGGRGESGATVYVDGNGVCGGAMGCGGDLLFTSLSNDAINNSAPHFHGPNNYSLQGRYTVISPGLRDNISLNNVTINNAPGQNFCTINADTATPSLEMLYIIRAF